MHIHHKEELSSIQEESYDLKFISQYIGNSVRGLLLHAIVFLLMEIAKDRKNMEQPQNLEAASEGRGLWLPSRVKKLASILPSPIICYELHGQMN
jgi:hypothetical protein